MSKFSKVRGLMPANDVREVTGFFRGDTLSVKGGKPIKATKETPLLYSPFTDTFFFEDEYLNRYEVDEGAEE